MRLSCGDGIGSTLCPSNNFEFEHRAALFKASHCDIAIQQYSNPFVSS